MVTVAVPDNRYYSNHSFIITLNLCVYLVGPLLGQDSPLSVILTQPAILTALLVLNWVLNPLTHSSLRTP